MGRGDANTLEQGRRRGEGSTKEVAHAEAFQLLVNPKIESCQDLLFGFDQLGRKLFPFSEFLTEEDADIIQDIEDEISLLFARERQMLHSNPTDLERMFLSENLLLRQARDGLLAPHVLQGLRDIAPPGEWNAEELLLLHFLRRSLPLLRLSGQSMSSLRKKMSDQLGIDIDHSSDQEIFAAITRQEARTRAERKEGLSDMLLFLQAVAASRGSAHVLRLEKMVKDNFSWASDRSELLGRRAGYLPLVADAKTLSWLAFPDAPDPWPHGLSACYLPGSSGVRAALIAAPEGGVDRDFLRSVMVHEMMHVTQEGFLLRGTDDDSFYAHAFNEALTEGLAYLRLKEKEDQSPHRPAYVKEVAALYRLLLESGTRPEDYGDRLSYLNSIPTEEAASLLAEWLEESEESIKERFSSLIEEDGVDQQRRGEELIREVFQKSKPFLPH